MTDHYGLSDEELVVPITKAGCRLLLTVAAGFDPRIVPDDGPVFSWHLALGATPAGLHMRTGDALAAVVEFYQADVGAEENRPRLVPGHLQYIVDGWHEQWRMAGRPGLPPIGGPSASPGISGPDLARRIVAAHA